MDINTVIAIISANSIVLAILAFLAKSIINHFLTKDVALFKSQLAKDASESMSAYQSELEKERIRLQISYGGIFEKQAKVIVELFRLITALEKTVPDATFSESPEDIYYDDFIRAWRDLVQYYDENRVLLPESVDDLISHFNRNAKIGVDGYRSTENQISRSNISDAELEKILSRQDRALVNLDEIPNLKMKLTEKFRSIIGVVS